jgi:hypothetical protein
MSVDRGDMGPVPGMDGKQPIELPTNGENEPEVVGLVVVIGGVTRFAISRLLLCLHSNRPPRSPTSWARRWYARDGSRSCLKAPVLSPARIASCGPDLAHGNEERPSGITPPGPLPTFCTYWLLTVARANRSLVEAGERGSQAAGRTRRQEARSDRRHHQATDQRIRRRDSAGYG